VRVLIAPQEFKGTLTATEAAEAIARGVRKARPEWAVDVFPIADGGPGTVDAFVRGTGATRVPAQVHDARGRAVIAEWALLGDTAVIEMAAASGLTRLPPELRDPRVTTTFGTGELVRAALDAGCRRVLIGAGGSATNDGGTGALAALGASFLDSEGRRLQPGGATLEQLARIDLSALDQRIGHAELVVLVDVNNPLLGELGCTRVFGPQKGAGAESLEVLERGLTRLDQVAREQLGVARADTPGAGAAGGLAYGLAAFAGASIEPGFDAIADRVRLDERIALADLVVTGEGCLDSQTAHGKGPARLAQRASVRGKPCVIFAGKIARRHATMAFTSALEISPGVTDRTDAAELLTAAAESWASLYA
jgi:glycerate kinase